MFDRILRPFKDRVVHPLARLLGKRLSPNAITLISTLIGLAAAAAVAYGRTGLGLLLWALNRLSDGLDGAVARETDKTSDLGGYLDIMGDFLVYAAIPIAFALQHYGDSVFPETALALFVLLGSFYVNAGSWMYLSAILEKRGVLGDGEITSVTMPEGLIGGTETVLFFTLFFLLPNQLVLLFISMGVLTLFSAIQRIFWALRKL
jgi:phosphatidylglycerophosphate synthase